MNTKNLNYLNVVILLWVYIINFLAWSWRLWVSMTNLANIFDFKYMPPGYFFMLAWWIIFVLSGFWLYELFKKNDKTWSLIFAIVWVLNILWSLASSKENYILATVVIFAMMYILYQWLKNYKNPKSIWHKVVGLYYGWISVAAVVLWISQVIFLSNPAVAKSSPYTFFILLAGVLVTYFSYQKFKNNYALLFACWGILGAIVGILTR